MAPRWKRPVVVVAASLAAFALVAAALDRGAFARAYPAPLGRDEAAVLGAIHDYQVAYQDFYATSGDATLLDAIPATKPLKHQIFRDIGFLRDAKLVLVQDLASNTVLESAMVGAGEAEVLVYEEWNWLLRRDPERQVVSQVRGLGQGFRYRVAREGGRWVVASWEVENVPPPKVGPVENW